MDSCVRGTYRDPATSLCLSCYDICDPNGGSFHPHDCGLYCGDKDGSTTSASTTVLAPTTQGMYPMSVTLTSAASPTSETLKKVDHSDHVVASLSILIALLLLVVCCSVVILCVRRKGAKAFEKNLPPHVDSERGLLAPSNGRVPQSAPSQPAMHETCVRPDPRPSPRPAFEKNLPPHVDSERGPLAPSNGRVPQSTPSQPAMRPNPRPSPRPGNRGLELFIGRHG